ncbi:hypothetical protein [Halorarius litoreus]|uniref:hypothetical protein n=1 Tax=Halorarius litoreus TaxID=2962676 RepID=UPI0020CC9199|nr:hypothetical protein [Halorarius litoreus]
METLELPTDETVTPDDVFLFGGYPYRFVPGEGEGFTLSPLYWGGGDMDIPFRDREELAFRWGDDGDASGPMTDEAWREWLAERRDDDRFDEAELDALARELGVAEDGGHDGDDNGLVGRLRDRLGR